MRSLIFLTVFLLVQLVLSGQEDMSKLRYDAQYAATNRLRLSAYQKIFRNFEFSNGDSAISYLQQGLNAFTADKYDLGVADVSVMMGGIYQNEGMYDVADQKINEGLSIFIRLQNKSGIANAHNNLGMIEGRKGNYDAAVQHFITALQLFENLNDSDGITDTYTKLGTANDHMKMYDKALEYYNKALAICNSNPSLARHAFYIYNNIGVLYCRKGSFDSAIIYINKAMELTAAPQQVQRRILPLTNMANIYREKGDTASALQYYKQALDIASKGNQVEDYDRLLLNMAVILAPKDSVKAMALLKEALCSTQTTGQKEVEAEVLDAIIAVCVFKNDYKEAFQFQQQQQDLQDSLYTIDKAKAIGNLQAVYELNKSNEQINELKVSEQMNARKKDIIIIIALFLAISVVTLIYFYSNSRKLNTRLAKHERELQTANDVKDKLFSIIGHDLHGTMANMPVLLNLERDAKTSADERVFIMDSLEETAVVSLEILENLLNWGKLQIKGIALHQTNFGAEGVINDVVRLMRVAIKSKQITVINDVRTGTLIYADENHFMFIVRNLLSNAIKYTRNNGQVTIAAEAHANPGFVTFSIRDNGIGMTKEKLINIFEQHNISTRGTANEAGNSIGLILCKNFITANGGKIWVESEEGKGSVFYFTMKQKEA